MRSAEKICYVTGEGKKQVGISGQKAGHTITVLDGYASRMVVSSLTLLSLCAPCSAVTPGE